MSYVKQTTVTPVTKPWLTDGVTKSPTRITPLATDVLCGSVSLLRPYACAKRPKVSCRKDRLGGLATLRCEQPFQIR